ncbi:hypothetical protein ATANTOWER_012281 [Ataeniobius toweri]|uniref:Uncharacterized protein n=1 Tax=Ataeniobius toweri TaxID=208326 RepID=A0ABU7CJY1_9TELE|nr:hypothetical protein [Ataeniobius toweri]
MGNSAAKAKYEQKVPAFYYRPTHTDCKLLREQWIRAKYERNEFEFIEKQEPYSAGKNNKHLDILQYENTTILLVQVKSMMKWNPVVASIQLCGEVSVN